MDRQELFTGAKGPGLLARLRAGLMGFLTGFHMGRQPGVARFRGYQPSKTYMRGVRRP